MSTATAAVTSASPTPRALWQGARGPIVVAVILGLLALIIAVTTPRGGEGLLDPDGVNGDGAHALAVLLEDNGITVTRVTSAAAALPLTGPDTTVVVTLSAIVPPRQLRALAATNSDLVVLAPPQPQLDALPVSLSEHGDTRRTERDPECGYSPAATAGAALMGGLQFTTGDASAITCYPTGVGASLVHFPGAARSITVLGTGQAFTNDKLDDDGNAALGLNVLGTRAHLVWVVPDLAALVNAQPGSHSLTSLLPDVVVYAFLQLAIVIVLLALWRARRLGPVVVEPLPVVVRAAETVEGQARLYRSAQARDRAAEALRTGTRERLLLALGLARDSEPPAVVDAVAAGSGRDPRAVQALLYGPAPHDDGALVRLADDLDALDREVRRP